MTRKDVAIPIAGVELAAWFYEPHERSEVPRPVIVMAHGLGGVREMGLEAFAERFVDAGYACLVFDYRHFGASGGEPRQLLDIGRQLQDWRTAVEFARSLDGIDPERVIVWGTSFGGGHAIIIASEDRRLAAAISQCPFTDGLASTLAIPPLTSVRVAARAVGDVIGSAFQRPPIMIPTYGPPNSTSLMTTPQSENGIRQLLPEGSDISPDVAARVALQIMTHSPGRRARDIECPILFAICEFDTVAPGPKTQKWAATAPYGEIKLYAADHFDIYVGDWFERNVTDQLAFLSHHVPVH